MFGSLILLRMLKAMDDLPILTQNCPVFLSFFKGHTCAYIQNSGLISKVLRSFDAKSLPLNCQKIYDLDTYPTVIKTC